MKRHSSIHPLALQFPLRWSGFSLIELMVAMTIGLLLLAGLFGIYISVAQSARSQAALALMQGNARYAFEIMGVDLRMIGFTGSNDASPQNVVNFTTASHLCPLVDLFGTKGCTDGAGPLVGYENTNPPNVCTTANTSPCYLTSTDSLTVVRVDTGDKYAVSAHTAGTSFTLSSWPTSNPPAAGEIFVAADYTHAAVFQVRTASSPTVSYSAGTVSPGNTGTGLGTFGGGINALSLYRLSGASYYIGRNPVGEPALYRDKLGHSGTTANSTPEELVQGVEDMNIKYGVDTDTTADGNVDSYWNANQVNAGTDGTLSMPVSITTASDRWKRVLSVRVTLFLVSGQNEKVGTTGDKLLRKSFSNTIAIRNRLPI
jgi:type IV pilus assembly protein PilW